MKKKVEEIAKNLKLFCLYKQRIRKIKMVEHFKKSMEDGSYAY